MKRLVLTSIGMLISFVLMAQPGSGPPPDPGEPLPISGIEVLLLGGAALGVGKMLFNRRPQNDSKEN